jgi:heme-degrading monooxygenase HmoA
MTTNPDRRSLIVGAAALLAAMAGPARGAARQATPTAPGAGLGYAALRIHTSQSAEVVAPLIEAVRETFAPAVAGVPGYLGYLVSEMPATPEQHFTLSLYESEEAAAGSTEAAQAFHEDLDRSFDDVDLRTLNGELFIAERIDGGEATPAATPAVDPLDGAFVALRIHTGKTGKPRRELAPVVQEAFRTVLAGVPGFRAYLWFATPEQRVSLSVFDTPEAAAESTERSRAYVNSALADYTEGSAEVIEGRIAYADLPLIGIDAVGA